MAVSFLNNTCMLHRMQSSIFASKAEIHFSLGIPMMEFVIGTFGVEDLNLSHQLFDAPVQITKKRRRMF